MSFFRNIIHFFFPPKKDTSMAAVRAALKSGRKRTDDPLTKEDEAWVQGKE